MGKVHHVPSRTYLLQYNNRQLVCFFDDACYQYFLVRLFNSLNQFHVDLHAYCLVAKDIYLLLSPVTPYGINNLWKSTTEQYNSYFTARFGRSIRIINKPYKTIETSPSNSALEAQKTIERIPLDIREAENPGTYRWSSYCDNGFGNNDSWLKPHPEYRQFLRENNHPYSKYREFIAMPARS